MSAQMYDDAKLARLARTWMTDDVAGTASDAHLDQILTATGQMRPAPRWLALLKEPPMRIQTQTRLVAGTPARRPILILAGLGLLILALVAVAVGAQLLQRPAASEDWPMFRGDASHAGPSVTGPVGRPVVAWRTAFDAPVTRNLAIVGELVYAVSDDGVVHALAADSGTERWAADIELGATSFGPAVVGGAMYVFDGAGRLRALDALTGQPRWTSATAALDPSPPSFTADALIVGTGDGDLVAFDLATGSERWRSRIGTQGRVNGPATDGSWIYAGTPGALVAVDAATGTERWRADTGADVTLTAAVAGGIAYLGGSPDAPTGRLRAFDAATGAERWSIDENLLSPIVSGDIAYASGVNGEILALDTASGAVQWRRAYTGLTRGPVLAGGVLYVPFDTEHRVYALDAATGGELWRFDVDGNNQCCIAVARGSVFVGTVVGSVYRISGDGSAIVPAPIPSAAAATPAVSTAPSAAPVAELAEFVWRSSGPGQGAIPPAGISFGPDGTIWAPDTVNNRFAIFQRDGMFVEYWGEPGDGDGQLNLARENGDGYGQVAFAPDGSFYVLDPGNRRVQRFDADREFVTAWGEFGTGPGQYNNPIGIAVSADGTVHVLDDVRGVVERYEPDGTVIDAVEVFTNTAPGFNKGNGLALDAEGNYYVSQSQPFQVAKFSPEGELLVTYGASGPGALRDWPGSLTVGPDGRVYVTQHPGGEDGILVFEQDGTFVGGFGPIGPGDGELDFPIGILLDGEGNAYILNVDFETADGQPAGELEGWRLLPPVAR